MNGFRNNSNITQHPQQRMNGFSGGNTTTQQRMNGFRNNSGATTQPRFYQQSQPQPSQALNPYAKQS